jgi:exonuclease VII small subunit
MEFREMERAVNYNDMLQEVNRILSGLERDTISVDDIASQLDGAYRLIDDLKKRLFDTEAQIQKVINARELNK